MGLAQGLDQLREIGPIFRSREGVAAGVSWRDLTDLRDEGDVLELSRGLFQLAGASGIGIIDLSRAPHGMIALDSPLSYTDFIDHTPSQGPPRRS